MRSRRVLLAGIAVAAAATAGAGLLAQVFPLKQATETLSRGPMRTEKVKENLYVVRGPFVPCGPRGCSPNAPDDGLIHEPGDVAIRITPAGVILIDDKFTENVAEVMTQLKSLTAQPVKYLLNTHHHADHASGNSVIRNMGIDIIGHKNIRANFLRIKQPGEPNVVFADFAAVYLGSVEVQLYYLGRGHTDGDTVVYFPDLKTVHTGDLIIDAMPVIDYDAGGSAVEFIKTIDNLLKIDFDTVIPGHGRVMNKDDVRAYKRRFEELNRRMEELAVRKAPKDPAQLKAALKLDDLGWQRSVSTIAYMRNITRHYDEMAARARRAP
jgi:glyoxylase-like metal-dependent hydrolase (beta-lactamase superfamily II)